jgi:hypothetical protein
MNKNDYIADSLINRQEQLDEDIMPLKKEQQKQDNSDTGRVYIKGVMTEFNEVDVLDHTLKISLPVHFMDMDPEHAKMNYR